jgi:hypothetical protein
MIHQSFCQASIPPAFLPPPQVKMKLSIPARYTQVFLTSTPCGSLNLHTPIPPAYRKRKGKGIVFNHRAVILASLRGSCCLRSPGSRDPFHNDPPNFPIQTGPWRRPGMVSFFPLSCFTHLGPSLSGQWLPSPHGSSPKM